jgi:hypothetical protein
MIVAIQIYTVGRPRRCRRFADVEAPMFDIAPQTIATAGPCACDRRRRTALQQDY